MLHAQTQAVARARVAPNAFVRPASARVATDAFVRPASARVATDAFVRPAKAKPSGIFPTAEITAESQSRPIAHRLPNLLNLLISDRNTSIRPILRPMRSPNPPISIGQSMHKHITSRRNSSGPRRRPIPHVRIRNVNRPMKLTVRIPRVQNVHSFRCLVIPLPRLRPHGISTQRHLVRLDDSAPRSATAACAPSSALPLDRHAAASPQSVPPRSRTASKQ
jgi:hypothetical protein